MNKKELAISLSKLKPQLDTSACLEQYSTECEIAAEILWIAFMNDEIKDKVIADFGCGNGILGIGALLLGAQKVYFVDIDKKAIMNAKENVKSLRINKDRVEFLNIDIKGFANNVDVVIQTPPFGVQNEHADRKFIVTAFNTSKVAYSLHKIKSKSFLEALARENKKNISLIKIVSLPLKRSKSFHKKKVHYVKIGVWRFE